MTTTSVALLFIKSKSQFPFGKGSPAWLPAISLGSAGDPAALEGPLQKQVLFREHLQKAHDWVRFLSVWSGRVLNHQEWSPRGQMVPRLIGSQWKGVSHTTSF